MDDYFTAVHPLTAPDAGQLRGQHHRPASIIDNDGELVLGTTRAGYLDERFGIGFYEGSLVVCFSLSKQRLSALHENRRKPLRQLAENAKHPRVIVAEGGGLRFESEKQTTRGRMGSQHAKVNSA